MSETVHRRTGYVAAAFVLGICVIAAATIFGYLHYKSRVRSRTISVVGSATERFTADIVKWRMSISKHVGVDEVGKGYVQLKKDRDALLDFLKESGFDTDAVVLKPLTTREVYDYQHNTVSGYTISQSLFLTSNDIEKVEKLALDPTRLFEKGVVLSQSHLEYYNSRIAELKRKLLDAATLDARRRAESIAKSSNLRVGAMLSARQGVFQITEPYSTEVSDYGVYSTDTREKEIRVTVRATFEVE